MNVLWTDQALAERRAQVGYIAQFSLRSANQMDATIDRAVGLLLRFPHAGRPSKSRGTRELVIRKTPFVAFYAATDNEIVVLRFFHGRQRRPGQRRSSR